MPLFRWLEGYRGSKAEITKVDEDKVVIKLGDFDLHFILNTTEPFESYKFMANSSEYGSGNIFYIEVDDIEETQKLVKQAGGVIKSDICDNLWDCKEFLFEDPSGYKFAFYQE